MWTHTQSFPTENFGVFYRKAHLSLVDTKVGLFKRSSFLSKHYFLVSGDLEYEFSAPRLGLSSTYFVSLAFFGFGVALTVIGLALLRLWEIGRGTIHFQSQIYYIRKTVRGQYEVGSHII